MSDKEATARIKINKLLEAAGFDLREQQKGNSLAHSGGGQAEFL